MLFADIFPHGIQICLDFCLFAQILDFMEGIIVVHVGGNVKCKLLICQHEFANVGSRGFNFPIELLPLENVLVLGGFTTSFDGLRFAVLDFLEIVPDGNEAPRFNELFSCECHPGLLAFGSIGVKCVGDFSVALTFVAVGICVG